jgi:hypothetical protein
LFKYHTICDIIQKIIWFVNPVIAGSGVLPDFAYAINIDDARKIAYVTFDGTQFGVTAFDITNPSAPAVYDSYYTANGANSVFCRNNSVYIADAQGGVEAINSSDPANLQYSADFGPVLDTIYSVTGDSNYIYAADEAFGFYVLNHIVDTPMFTPTWTNSPI